MVVLTRFNLYCLPSSIAAAVITDKAKGLTNRLQDIFVSVTVVTEAETGSFEDRVARPPFLRNAVFLYRLPNHPEAERFADEIVRARPGTSPRMDWSTDMVSDPIKILIVDDDEQVLIELERLLESEGYSTTTAWGGREALAYTEQMQFDVLLVDEDMTHPEWSALSVELKRRQPQACFLQMHARKNHGNAAVSGIYKWEHAEVKATIRNFLAA